MRVRDLLAALVAQWAEVRALLTEDQYATLVGLVGGLVGEKQPDRLLDHAEDIVDFLTGVLPDGHPVLLVLEERVNRLAGPPNVAVELARWQPVVASLRSRLRGTDEVPTVLDVERGAAEWLLAAESMTEAQVRDTGHDPADPDLIGLQGPGGVRQWPAFQFRPERSALIRSINRVLGVIDDPWGVADWWLGENSWLGGVPAQLVGVVDGEELLAAARDEWAEG